MEWIWIPLTAGAGAVLTFYSGFGLGTLLLPVFLIYFPVSEAVALTAIVHFLNNIFKSGLTFSAVNWKKALSLGLPGIPAAILGAWILTILSEVPILSKYSFLGVNAEVTVEKILMAILLAGFTVFEIWSPKKEYNFSTRGLILGGALSGFMGGLSGHQGALRSVFLSRTGLSAKAFIATGTCISLGIDMSRIATYMGNHTLSGSMEHWKLLTLSLGAALLGSWWGNQQLTKITIHQIRVIIAVCMGILAILLGSGLR